jgi:hypothetical protein
MDLLQRSLKRLLDQNASIQVQKASNEAKLPLKAVASSESTKATGAQASIVWRGGLNARLAKIMAKEYSRITNPIPV